MGQKKKPEIMTELEKETRRFVAVCRDHGDGKIKGAAIRYARAVELHISSMEMDLFHQHVKIRGLIANIQLHVDVLKAYGINTSILGSRSMESIYDDIYMAENHGQYKIPENIQKFIKHD
jgi:hypothetical protein